MRIPPPLIAISAALVQRALTRDAQRPGLPRAAAAGTIAAASIALAGASALRFRRSGTTVEPFEPARASVLVTSGVNSISRNPMYVGMAGLLVANVIRSGEWVGVLPVLGFVLVIDRYQVAPEESALLANFGADYEAYRAAVPRWLDRRSAEALIRM
jgi:protein-S-isoprenylcysteine O-methyltransferase Ste14